MNGSDALLATLRANDVTAVFANPGTSEMHFVAALDAAPEMRGILCLFEGVATGAADGYARASGRLATTLLHLGPGLGNGWANLHNARRARVPLLNIVGDHATYHERYDAPLQSDIATLAAPLEGWVHRNSASAHVSADTARAISAAYGPPAQVATLILPADASWNDVSAPAQWPLAERHAPASVDERDLGRSVAALRGKKTGIFLGSSAADAPSFALAHAIAERANATVIMETFPTIYDHGNGVVQPDRLIYLSEFAQAQLRDFEAFILIGATTPVSFFAYPDIASDLLPADCDVIALAPPGTNTADALGALASALEVSASPARRGDRPEAPTGALTTAALAQAVAATLPEGVVIADESNTGGMHLYHATQFAAPHRVMTLTGGAIGFGLPNALGAAVATGGRVLCLEADGSFMYTPQALWSMARENLDVTVVVLANRSYAILNLERQRVGVVAEDAASQHLLDIDNPTLDFCAIATGMGVPARRVTSADELVAALRDSYATKGPMLIEAVLPKGLS